jgi:hypothetical protein
MATFRILVKEGDIVYVMDRKIRGRVLGRLKYLVLLEVEGTHEKLKEHRGNLRVIHPKLHF